MPDPKIVLAIALVGLAAVVGRLASRRDPNPIGRDPAVEINSRVTGYVAMVLLIPLAAEVVTGVRPGLVPHALIGFFLLPVVGLKLASVGYRFTRYYIGDPRYRAAGPPHPIARVIGPALVLATVALFGTGVELWLFGLRFGEAWLTWHKVAFVLWFVLMLVHVVAYLQPASELAIADSRDRSPGAFARRSLVAGCLLFGVALAIAMLPFSSPFALLPDSG
jgi:hypothetical protein